MFSTPDLRPDACLGATSYCDVDHADIQALAQRARVINADDRRTAAWLFETVRDEVLYYFGPWGVPASETLRACRGGCTNKNNLLVALLRATGIPAAYGVLSVDASRYFGVISPPLMETGVSTSSIHVYSAAWLDGAWVRCDVTNDAEMSAKTAHYCPQNQLVIWDGVRHADEPLDPAHVHADLGLFVNIDDRLAKPARRAAAIWEVLNHVVDTIRDNPPFPDPISLHRECRLAVERDSGLLAS